MLDGRRVLIVEDEALVALELTEIVTGSNAYAVGPARTNREALALIDLEAIDVAILDLNLADGEATPTAECLIAKGVPVLICTGGVLPRAMRLMWPDLPMLRKPLNPERLVEALGRCVRSRLGVGGVREGAGRARSTPCGLCLPRLAGSTDLDGPWPYTRNASEKYHGNNFW